MKSEVFEYCRCDDGLVTTSEVVRPYNGLLMKKVGEVKVTRIPAKPLFSVSPAKPKSHISHSPSSYVPAA